MSSVPTEASLLRVHSYMFPLFHTNRFAGGRTLKFLITDSYAFRSREVIDFPGEIRVYVTRGNVQQKPKLTHLKKMPQW